MVAKTLETLNGVISLIGGNPLPLMAKGAGYLFDQSPEAKTLYAEALEQAWREASERRPDAQLAELKQRFFLEQLEGEQIGLLSLHDISIRIETNLKGQGYLTEALDSRRLFSTARFYLGEKVSKHLDVLGPLLLHAVSELEDFRKQHAKDLDLGLSKLAAEQKDQADRLQEQLEAISERLPQEVQDYLQAHLKEMLLARGILQQAQAKDRGIAQLIGGDVNAPIFNVTGDGNVLLVLGEGETPLGSLQSLLRRSFARPLLKLERRRWIENLDMPSVLLSSEYEQVPFYGREVKLEDLMVWCRTSERFSLRFYRGAGGIGKTRLMRELCKRLLAEPEEHWQAGFLDGEAVKDSMAYWPGLFEGNKPLLIIVDYAETKREALTELFKQVRRHYRGGSAPVRVVLLARNDAFWWSELRSQSQLANLPDNATPLAPVQEERKESFRYAARAFAEALGKKDIPNAPEASLKEAYFDRVLMVHMLALLMLTRAGYQAASEMDVLDGIFELERDFWRKHAGDGLGKDEVAEAIGQVMTLVTLGYTLQSHDDASSLLTTLDYTKGYSRPTLSRLTQSCHQLYGGVNAWLEPLRPDILGEHLIERTLLAKNPAEDRPDLRAELLTLAFDTEAAQPEQGLAVLIRLAQRRSERGLQLLHEVLSTRWDRLAKAASFAMPVTTTALRQLAVTATRHAYTKAEDLLEGAFFANNLSVRLGDLGRREEALTAIEEAVESYRELAQRNRDAFLPNLATSLNNLSGRLSDLGRREEALTAIEEAVGLLQPYFLRHPMAFMQWMSVMLRQYLALCQELEKEPDIIMLEPILDVWQRFQSGQ